MSKCPYCNIEVSETAIENEDGCCPECGAMISAPDLGMGGDYDDEFEDDEEQDIFSDLEDDIDFQNDVDFDGSDYEEFDDEEFNEEFEDEEDF